MRKDNDLLILANERLNRELTGYATPAELLGYVPKDNTIPKSRYRKPLRPLQGHFTDYASEFIDCTSPCERLPDDYQRHLDKPLSKSERLKALKAERDWFLEQDQDKDFVQKWDINT